jgi:hypothetical protein
MKNGELRMSNALRIDIRNSHLTLPLSQFDIFLDSIDTQSIISS